MVSGNIAVHANMKLTSVLPSFYFGVRRNFTLATFDGAIKQRASLQQKFGT